MGIELLSFHLWAVYSTPRLDQIDWLAAMTDYYLSMKMKWKKYFFNFFSKNKKIIKKKLFFQHLLPLNVISSSGLAVVYNSANFKTGGTFSFAASYNFHNEETCGPRRVSSPLGKPNLTYLE